MDPHNQPAFRRPSPGTRAPLWQPFSFRHPPQMRVLLSLQAPSRRWTLVHGTLEIPASQARQEEHVLCLRALPDVGAAGGLRRETVMQQSFLCRDYPSASPGGTYRLCFARRAGTVIETLTLTGASLAECRAALQAAKPLLHLLPTAGTQSHPSARQPSVPARPAPVTPSPVQPLEMQQVRPVRSSAAFPEVSAGRSAAEVKKPTKRRSGGKAFVKFLIFLVILGALAFGAHRFVLYQWGSWDAAIKYRFNPSSAAPGFPADSPEISDRIALRDYLNAQYAAGETVISFTYSGDDLSAEKQTNLFYNMTNVLYINLEKWGEDRFRVTLTPYPGDRMLQAYRTNDESTLSADEKKALNEAKKILDAAKQSSSNQMTLELALHDAICKRVSYDSPTISDADKNVAPGEVRFDAIHRHETVVGALLDGRANCQGYSDAFYLLASMAGFEVSRQSAVSLDTEDEKGGEHRFNTICLDGNWYIVDVTFDDPLGSEGKNGSSYRLFNAGRDVGMKYYQPWDAAIEPHPIAAISGKWYYYNYWPGDGSALDYQKRFTSLSSLAGTAVREYRQNGRSSLLMLLDGQTVSESQIKAALKPYNITWKAVWSSDALGTVFSFQF